MAELNVVSVEDLLNAIQSEGPKGAAEQYRVMTLPSKVLFALSETRADYPDVALFLALYPNTPNKLLGTLVRGERDPKVAVALASHPRATPDILQSLAARPELSVRKAVAANRSITPRTAMILTQDRHAVIRMALAENPTQFSTSQERLCQDAEPCVRVALVNHKKRSAKSVVTLLDDPDAFVRYALALQAELSDHELLAIADSEDYEQQWALSRRTDLPAPVLESLCFSKHKDIAIKAIQRKVLSDDELLGWARHEDPEFRAVIARRADLPEAIQDVIINDSNPSVVKLLAMNRAIAESAANVLIARGPSEDILIELAMNPAVIGEPLARLCESGFPNVNRALATRRDLNDKCLDILLNRVKDYDLAYSLALSGYRFSGLSREATKTLIASELPTVRAFAAESMNLEPRDTPRLAYDPSPLVRARLAIHPNVTENALRYLAHDQHPRVAAAARERLEKNITENDTTAPTAARVDIEQETRPDNDTSRPGVLSRLINKLKGS